MLRTAPILRVILSIILIGGLTACAGDGVKDRPGVKEAKACVKATRAKKPILEKYEIQSCTNNGVWIAQNISSGEVFDFLNKTYTSPETGELETDQMSSDKVAIFNGLRRDLNKELLEIYD